MKGYTLAELVMVILLLSILSAVAIPNFFDFATDARKAVTKDEMLAIKRAITGDSRVSSGSTYVYPGYEADMGAPPGALGSLTTNPGTGDATVSYNPLARTGWRGPYVDSSTLSDYLKDAWGTAYYFTTSPRVIRSWGKDLTDDSGADDDISLTY